MDADPTGTILVVLALVEMLSRQRLLCASLASSACLIYLDPHHATNNVRILASAHLIAACVGVATYHVLGAGYLSASTAMVLTILLMIRIGAVHPPAVSTALSFALRTDDIQNLALFSIALGITVILVGLERLALWTLSRFARSTESIQKPL